MKKVYFFTVFIFLFVSYVQYTNGADGNLEALTANPVVAFSGTKGISTFYQFYFRLKSEIKSGASIQIKFPEEFWRFVTGTEAGRVPECALKYKGQTAFKIYPCSVSDSWIVEIIVGTLTATDYELDINYVLNPSNQESSGRFGVFTLQDSGLVEANQNFGAVKFTNPPGKKIKQNKGEGKSLKKRARKLSLGRGLN